MGGCCSNEMESSNRNMGSSNMQQGGGRNVPAQRVQPQMQRVPWDNEYRNWTDEQLQEHRKMWWETRVTNSTEVWQAIRMYVETTNEDARRSIVLAAGLTPFQVDEKNNVVFCYDRKGAMYDIPFVILKNPTRSVDANGAVLQKPKDAEEVKREQSKLSIKIRLSNGVDFKVECMGTETIGSLKKRVCEEYKIAPERQRFLYQGELFTDSTTTLARANIKYTSPSTVLQVFIVPDDVPLSRR